MSVFRSRTRNEGQCAPEWDDGTTIMPASLKIDGKPFSHLSRLFPLHRIQNDRKNDDLHRLHKVQSMLRKPQRECEKVAQKRRRREKKINKDRQFMSHLFLYGKIFPFISQCLWVSSIRWQFFFFSAKLCAIALPPCISNCLHYFCRSRHTARLNHPPPPTFALISHSQVHLVRQMDFFPFSRNDGRKKYI